jgi:hypothetical protein
VLEFAHTTFVGDLMAYWIQLPELFGTGLELKTIASNTVERVRLMARYQLGEHARGWSLGLAADF